MILTGNTPIFEAVADYFRKMIAHGVIKPGDALPSVREVALAERINPNTVARAYALLVEEGLVESLPKKGYFVTSSSPKQDASLKKALLSLLSSGYREEDILSALEEIKGERHD